MPSFTTMLDQSKASFEESVASAKKVQEDFESSKAAFMVLEPSLQARIMRPDQHAKAARILMRMETAGYSHEQINDVVRALVAIDDEEMRPAFDLFAGADGVVDAEELKSTVPLLGEDMSDEQIRCLFKMADTDKSGKIEFGEFCQMMYALTPKADKGGLLDITAQLVTAQEALEAATAAVDAAPSDPVAVNQLAKAFADLVNSENEMKMYTTAKEEGSKSYMEQAQGAVSGGEESLLAVRVIEAKLYAKMYRPEDYARVGRIVTRMTEFKKRDFSDEDINDVIQSLVAKDNRDMARAYAMWAGDDGKIDAAEFSEIVPLLGEDVTQEEVTAMFAHVDEDGSGLIELVEFCNMMKVMQMNRDAYERYKLVGKARAQAYANTKL